MSNNNESKDKKPTVKREFKEFTLAKDVLVGGDAKKKPRVLKKGSKIKLTQEGEEIWRRKHRLE